MINRGHFDADEILPRLWVGAHSSCEPAKMFGFKTICVFDSPCSDGCTHIPVLDFDNRHLKHDMIQKKGEKLTNEEYRSLICANPHAINKVVEKVMEWQKDYNVLVHCAAGQERSPLVAVVYIMNKFHLDIDTAYTWVKKQRPITQDRRIWLHD